MLSSKRVYNDTPAADVGRMICIELTGIVQNLSYLSLTRFHV